MKSLMEFLLLALFVWRVSSLLSMENGPYMILERFRHRIGVRRDPATNEIWGTNELSKLFVCMWCLSFWVSIVVTVLFLLSPRIVLWISFPFALSAVACLLSEYVE